MFLIVTTFYWKLTLTRQFTFLESLDQADQILPWLDLDVSALKHGTIPLWTPYEWDGQSLIGQVQPGVVNPFNYLLALLPTKNGHIQIACVHLWFVLIHLVAAWFAYFFLKDLNAREPAAILGAALYATMGFYGNTDWPQFLTAAIWAPLIFLFIFRVARGRAPLASSGLAGFFTGMSWLSGYHVPPIYLTITGSLTLLWILKSPRAPLRRRAGLLMTYAVVLGLVSALQVLPAVEYGRRALRWTGSGALHWNDRVGYPEHVDSGFKPSDLLHLVLPGADKQIEPFTGAIALCLAAMAVVGAFRRPEVRILTAIAAGALLLSLPRNTFLYGAIYVLVPMLEKARAPAFLMCIFHFAVAVLAGFGLEQILSPLSSPHIRRVAKIAAAFGAFLLALYIIADALRPALTSGYLVADARPAMLGFLALLFAAVCTAALRGALRLSTTAILVCLLALIEQGNVSGYYWVHNSEKDRKTFLKAIDESRSLAVYLKNHQPSRTEINRTDFGNFNFGDWHRIETVEALVPSMPETTNKLGWWDDRASRLFGVRYTISRKPTRPGQTDVFTSAAGMKIFENPGVLPRVWTVHSLRAAADDPHAVAMILDGTLDPAREAIISGSQPSLQACPEPDRVSNSHFNLQSLQVNVEMSCRGLLLVSDNWYPGWSASVDGNSATILKADTTIRALVLEKGSHTVTMSYRPLTVTAGFLLFMAGTAVTLFLVRRKEEPGPDLLMAQN